MLKKALLISVALAGFPGAVVAADIAPRRALAPIVTPPAFTWGGFYVGFNAGAAWRDNKGRAVGGTPASYARPDLCSTNQTGECYNAFPGTLPFPAVPADPAANAAFGVFLSDVRLPLQGANRPVVLNGPGPFSALGGRGRHDATFLGGAQIGGQAQFGSIVIGVEADFNWLGSRGRGSGSSDSQFAFAGENDGAFTATRTGPLLRTYPGGLAALPAEAATTVNFIDLGPNYGVRYNGQVAMAERDQDRWLSTLGVGLGSPFGIGS